MSSSLTAAVLELRGRIEKLQRENPQDFEWYPYDSLASAARLEELPGSAQARALDAARADGVLDIGCGDGAMSFLMESLGCAVDAIDHPTTNHNGMRGVHALKRLLGSSIRIAASDIDSQLTLPPEPRGLALCLGVLYHLKNPFYVLETLAKHAAYCFLSTRVARCLPDGSPLPENQPIAYLVEADELNADETNYWIFSRAGLNRLLRRTHWEVLAWLSVGDTKSSDPVHPDRDERVFCLLRSRYGLANVELLEGWHENEGAGWRWTKRRFSLRGDVDSTTGLTKIEMRLFVPPEVFERLGPITLSASVNDRVLPALTLDRAGDHIFTRSLSGQAGPLLFVFELDRWIPAGPADPREFGIIVASVNLL